MKNQKLKFIIGIVVIGLLLFSVIFTRIRSHKVRTKDIDINVDSSAVAEDSAIDYDSYDYEDINFDEFSVDEDVEDVDNASSTDADDSVSLDDGDIEYSESKNPTTEATTEQVTTEAPNTESVESEEGNAANEDKASQVPVAKSNEESEQYWKDYIASVSTDLFSEVELTSTNISDIIKGNLLGNIYGCAFTTTDFKNIYVNGFFADIVDCEISELNWEGKSCIAKITFTDNSVKEYNVSYKLDSTNSRISDIVCTEK